ncbi:unnamed protein product [Paramecium octaurelia]|uniref:Uncharacterized protein n=1 Tax=Paramecium octaurelia TaxID=43137 RepID=A0A8S1XYC0_PAROT|nr:unnamed protein product [Paramecium octaurelia]
MSILMKRGSPYIIQSQGKNQRQQPLTIIYIGRNGEPSQYRKLLFLVNITVFNTINSVFILISILDTPDPIIIFG